MSVHPMPRRCPPAPVKDAESVYRELRSRGVPAALANRAARSMYPAPAPAPAEPSHAETMPVVDPDVRWLSPYVDPVTEDAGEWWTNPWLILAVLLGGLLIAAGWVLYAAVIIAWIVARAIWLVFLTVLAGAAGGMMAALLRR